LESDATCTLNFKLTRTASGATFACGLPEFPGYEATFDETAGDILSRFESS
jgi:hypothetical protein